MHTAGNKTLKKKGTIILNVNKQVHTQAHMERN